MPDVYEIITEYLVNKLESGTIPWRQPWRSEEPKNLVSKRDYRGVNVFILTSTGYASPYWVTYRQAEDLGGHVRKGEHATPIIFWKMIEKEQDDEVTSVPCLRYYRVFNALQCEGLPIPPTEEHLFAPITNADAIIHGMPDPPTIQHGSSHAGYQVTIDTVRLPIPERFGKPEWYYATLFHELTHSTGHPKRLHRFSVDDLPGFRSRDYSLEELVAEMGAAFLCGHAGIQQQILENAASYIAGWLGALRNDKRLLITAGSKAQRAADYIRNTTTPEYSDTTPNE